MFSSATSFNQDISMWNTSKVTNMVSMFTQAKSFNQPLNNWDTSNVELMYGMFSGNEQFNQDISSWDTSKVTRMNDMFYGAENFNQDISSWNTGNVVNMNNMFGQAFNFNQNIGNWDTRNVTHMQNMFTGARSFDQNIGTWDISSLDSGGLQFFCQNKYEPFATSNYDAILIGWSTLSGSETQIPINVSVDFYNSQYSTAGESARNKLINDYNWTITDGGEYIPHTIRVGSPDPNEGRVQWVGVGSGSLLERELPLILNNGDQTNTIHLKAKPGSNYVFSHWESNIDLGAASANPATYWTGYPGFTPGDPKWLSIILPENQSINITAIFVPE
jgi:surface protein